MKNIIVIALCMFALFGCGGSSSSDSDMNLVGTWVGSCHEVRDGDDDEFLGYAIDVYEFTEVTYSLLSTYHDDPACEFPNGAIDEYEGIYNLEGLVVTLDGRSAFRMTMHVGSPGWPDSLPPIEMEIFIRVEGDKFILGDYNGNQIPELFDDFTYVRQ